MALEAVGHGNREAANVPAGVQLVQGISRPTPWQMPINASLPGDLGNEHPVTVSTLAGNVAVAFKKLRAL